MIQVISPIKTMHGTSAESLVNDYCEARAEVNAAIERMAKVEFNGRDYSDQNTFQSAKIERMANLQKLKDVAEYLEAMAIACSKLRNNP